MIFLLAEIPEAVFSSCPDERSHSASKDLPGNRVERLADDGLCDLPVIGLFRSTPMPRPTKPIPYTWEELHGAFDYNPDTGELRWKIRPNVQSFCRAGDPVTLTTGTHGYQSLRLWKQTFMAHRVIWKWMTGEDPLEGKVVDHRNRNKTDNRWQNLRIASFTENTRNRNRSEDSNISFQNGKWVVRVAVDGGGVVRVGRYIRKGNARRAAKEARLKYHGEFATDHHPSPAEVRRQAWLDSSVVVTRKNIYQRTGVVRM